MGKIVKMVDFLRLPTIETVGYVRRFIIYLFPRLKPWALFEDLLFVPMLETMG